MNKWTGIIRKFWFGKKERPTKMDIAGTSPSLALSEARRRSAGGSVSTAIGLCYQRTGVLCLSPGFSRKH